MRNVIRIQASQAHRVKEFSISASEKSRMSVHTGNQSTAVTWHGESKNCAISVCILLNLYLDISMHISFLIFKSCPTRFLSQITSLSLRHHLRNSRRKNADVVGNGIFAKHAPTFVSSVFLCFSLGLSKGDRFLNREVRTKSERPDI